MLNDFVDVLPYECWNRVLRQPESFCLSWNAWSTLERNYVYCQDYLVKGPCLERRAISCSRLLSPSIIQSFDNTVRLLYEFGGIKELLSGIPLPTNRLRRWHWNFYSTIGDFCPFCPFVLLESRKNIGRFEKNISMIEIKHWDISIQISQCFFFIFVCLNTSLYVKSGNINDLHRQLI